jgi:hypothetical protein
MNKSARMGLAVLLGLSALAVQNAHGGAAVAHGSNGHLVASVGQSVDVVKQRAIDICRRKGGINVRIIAATDVFGYGAIAVAAKGTGSVIGVALGKRSATEADAIAIDQCLKAGGSAPKIIRAWKG